MTKTVPQLMWNCLFELGPLRWSVPNSVVWPLCRIGTIFLNDNFDHFNRQVTLVFPIDNLFDPFFLNVQNWA